MRWCVQHTVCCTVLSVVKFKFKAIVPKIEAKASPRYFLLIRFFLLLLFIQHWWCCQWCFEVNWNCGLVCIYSCGMKTLNTESRNKTENNWIEHIFVVPFESPLFTSNTVGVCVCLLHEKTFVIWLGEQQKRNRRQKILLSSSSTFPFTIHIQVNKQCISNRAAHTSHYSPIASQPKQLMECKIAVFE